MRASNAATWASAAGSDAELRGERGGRSRDLRRAVVSGRGGTEGRRGEEGGERESWKETGGSWERGRGFVWGGFMGEEAGESVR